MPVPSTIGVAQIILSAQSSLLTKGFLDAQKQIAQFTNNITSIGKAWLSLSAIKTVGTFIADSGAAILETKRLADQVGITAESYRALQTSAELAGVGQAQFAASISHLQTEMAGLAVESQQQVDDFRAIGLTFEDLRGKNFSQDFALIAQKLNVMQDATARSAAAAKLFGDQGRQLVPILGQIAAGAQVQAEAAKSFNNGVDAMDTAKVQEAATAFGVLSVSAHDFGQKAAAWLAPAGNAFAELGTVIVGLGEDALGSFVAEFRGLVTVGNYAGLKLAESADWIVSKYQAMGQIVDGFGKAVAATWDYIKVASESPIASITYEFTQMFAGLSRMNASLMEGLSNYLDYANHSAAEAYYNMALSIRKSADEADVASRKTYKAISDGAYAASNDMANAWSKVFNAAGKGSETLQAMASAYEAAGKENGAAFMKGITDAITFTNTRGKFNFFETTIASSTDSAVAAAADAAKRVQETFQRTAEQQAQLARQREAFIGTANNDPRVLYAQDVASLQAKIGLDYTADEAKREADNRAILRAFYADPNQAQSVVYERRVVELKDQIAESSRIANAQRMRQEEQERTQYAANFFGDISTLAGAYAEQSKVMFMASKAAAMAQAEINAWMAYSNVMASPAFIATPGLQMVFAAAALAAGQVAVANIAMQQAPGRANGGPVSRGHTYLTGERGPELITMGANGYVTPNNAMGGGTTLKQTVTIINNVPGAAVRQETSADGLNMNVIFDQLDTATAGGIRSGTSKTAKAMEAKYGLNGSRGAH